MKSIIRVFCIFLIAFMSCSPFIKAPYTIPVSDSPVIIESVALRGGRLYVVKSEIIPGKFYLEAATKIPARKNVWLEIYVAEGNRIRLSKRVAAKRIPSQPEKWYFDEFDRD